MKRPSPTTLRDAEPEPWRAPRRPDPTPEQTRLFRASAALIAAQTAIAGHVGPYAGDEWRAKTEAHRRCWEEFVTVFDAIKGGGE